MVDFLGREVVLCTENEVVKGTLVNFDKEIGKIVLKDPSNNKIREFDILDVVDVKGVEEVKVQQSLGKPIPEEEMYKLFYEAFNVYGPFEDGLCSTVSIAMKKFLKDLGSSKICVVVGSDDIFGRIGLCFARFVFGKSEELVLHLEIDLNDLRSIRYREAYLNSGGEVSEERKDTQYTMCVYAANRHYVPERYERANINIFLDIPKEAPHIPFTSLGIGCIPENFSLCRKFCYIVDVGFPPVLAKKYNVSVGLRGSLVKMDYNYEEESA